jgi:hypothetical protein
MLDIFTKSEDKKKTPAERTVVNNRFSFKLPPEWKENTVYSYEGPEEDGIKHNILINIEHNIGMSDLEKYAAIQINGIENELQGYFELKREETKLDRGLSAYELVFKWYPVENVEIYQKIFYVLSNNTGYCITATFSKKTFKMMGAEVDKILKSFNIPQV